MAIKPRGFTQFSREKTGTLKREFERSNPDYWTHFQGRAGDIERAREIITHTTDAEQILNENFEAERQQRIARMAVQVWKDRARDHDYVAPQVAAHLMAENSILKEAARRVDESHRQDLAAVRENEAESLRRIAKNEHQEDQSLSKKEIENMSDLEKSAHFKAELHKLVDNSNEARVQVSKLMNQERVRMIKEAEERGAQDPVKEVSAFQGRMYRDVQDKLHGDIHALCVKYGYSADQQQVAFHAEHPEADIRPQQGEADHGHTDTSTSNLGTEAGLDTSQRNQRDDQEQ